MSTSVTNTSAFIANNRDVTFKILIQKNSEVQLTLKPITKKLYFEVTKAELFDNWICVRWILFVLDMHF